MLKDGKWMFTEETRSSADFQSLRRQVLTKTGTNDHPGTVETLSENS